MTNMKLKSGGLQGEFENMVMGFGIFAILVC